jgi:hypothetical protein
MCRIQGYMSWLSGCCFEGEVLSMQYRVAAAAVLVCSACSACERVLGKRRMSALITCSRCMQLLQQQKGIWLYPSLCLG